MNELQDNEELIERLMKEFCYDMDDVELMQEFCKDNFTIQCYNLTNCTECKNDYAIAIHDEIKKVCNYAYFNTIPNMFAYYDILKS